MKHKSNKLLPRYPMQSKSCCIWTSVSYIKSAIAIGGQFLVANYAIQKYNDATET